MELMKWNSSNVIGLREMELMKWNSSNVIGLREIGTIQ